jgi:hypothetical protein
VCIECLFFKDTEPSPLQDSFSVRQKGVLGIVTRVAGLHVATDLRDAAVQLPSVVVVLSVMAAIFLQTIWSIQ